MELTRLATADYQPITLDEVKSALGLGWPDQNRDQNIESVLIPAAVRYAENRHGLTLQRSTWEYIREGWPPADDPIELPSPPTLCLKTFQYSQLCCDWINVDEENFRLQNASTGMKIYPCTCWPRVCCQCNTCCGSAPRVKSTYDAGYDTSGDMPANIVEGLNLYVEYLLHRTETSQQIADQLLDQEANLRASGYYG